MSDERPTPQPLAPLAWRPLAVVLVVLVGGLLALATRYGFHRDELYFLASGRRLAWGYPDQGPLTPLLARLADEVAPGSLLALRVPAALLTATTTLAAAATARELGGRVVRPGARRCHRRGRHADPDRRAPAGDLDGRPDRVGGDRVAQHPDPAHSRPAALAGPRAGLRDRADQQAAAGGAGRCHRAGLRARPDRAPAAAQLVAGRRSRCRSGDLGARAGLAGAARLATARTRRPDPRRVRRAGGAGQLPVHPAGHLQRGCHGPGRGRGAPDVSGPAVASVPATGGDGVGGTGVLHRGRRPGVLPRRAPTCR